MGNQVPDLLHYLNDYFTQVQLACPTIILHIKGHRPHGKSQEHYYTLHCHQFLGHSHWLHLPISLCQSWLPQEHNYHTYHQLFLGRWSALHVLCLKLHHYIAWWHTYFHNWNGVSSLCETEWLVSPRFKHLTSFNDLDLSCYFHCDWYQSMYPPMDFQDQQMSIKRWVLLVNSVQF